jgi:hypothetical protein
MSFQDPPGSRYVAGGGEDASASSGRYTSSASVAATSVSTQTPRGVAATSGTAAATSPRNLKYPSRREKDSEREQSIAILGAPTASSQKSRPLLHHRYAPTASASAAAATIATRSSTAAAASLSYKDQKRAAQPQDDFELSETVIVENYPTSHSTLEPLPSQPSRNNGAAATNATRAARGSFALPSASPNTSTIFMDERSFLSVGTGMEGQQAFPTALHELDASVAVARTIGGARKFGGAGDRDSQSLTLTRPDPDSLAYSATTAADTNFHSNVSDLTGWDDSQKQSSEPPDIPPPQHIQTRAFSDSLLMRKHPYAAAASSPSRKKGGRGKKGNIPLPSTMSEREDYPVLVGLDPDTLSQSSSIPPPSPSSSRRHQPKKPPAQMRSGRVQFILDTNYNEDMDDDNEPEPTKQTTTMEAGPSNQTYADEEGQQAGSIALDQNASTDGLSERLGLPSLPPPPPSSDALVNHDHKDDDAEFATPTSKRRLQVGIAVVVLAIAIIVTGVLVYAAPWRSRSESQSVAGSKSASNMMPAAPMPSQTAMTENASPALAPQSASSGTGPPSTIPPTGPLAAPMPASSTAALMPPMEPMPTLAPTAPPTMMPPMDTMTSTTTVTPEELGPPQGDVETLTTMAPADHSAIPPSSNTPAPMIPSTFLPTAIPLTRAPMDASPSYIPTTSFSPTKSFKPTTALYPTITPEPTEYSVSSSLVSGSGGVANSPEGLPTSLEDDKIPDGSNASFAQVP